MLMVVLQLPLFDSIMRIDKHQLDSYNEKNLSRHRAATNFLSASLGDEGHDVNGIIEKISKLQIAIPSWALGTGGTRFGRFSGGGEPRSLEEKIMDIGMLHGLNQSSGSISLHIPWDIPSDAKAIKSLASELKIEFDAVNSNTFQDHSDQQHSYKFGSLAHAEKQVRKLAIDHNIEVIKYGEMLGSKALTVWLADGSCFPGQANFRKAFQRTLSSLEDIYKALPSDWKVLVEYKPYEPNFYSTVIQDLRTSRRLGYAAFGLA
jgi:L-rhamnose isomerase/sugar isomerase